MLAINENNIQALVGLARLAQSGNDMEAVARHLVKARLNNKLALEPRLMLANYYLRRGDSAKALEVAREAGGIAPERPQVLDVLGQAEQAAGNYPAAVAQFSKLSAQVPDNAEVLYRLALAQASAGNTADAAVSLNKAGEIDPDNPMVLSARTTLALREGRHDEALGFANALKEKQPQAPEGYALEGDAYLAMDQLEEATRAYEKAYSVQKTSLLAIKLHGAYRAAGKRDEAMNVMEQWLKDNPDDPGAKSVLAGSYLQEGDNANAKRLYNEVLQKYPDHVLSLNNLAWLMHEEGSPEAVKLAERAYRMNPDLANVADTYAWILIESDQVEQGLTLLRKVIDKGAKDPSIRYHYATGLSRSGDRLRAVSELESILAGGAPFAEREAAQKLLEDIRGGR